MRAALSALALCLLAASPAAAGGYGELNAGLAAHNEAAWDDAIAHLTAALGDRALPAASVAAAHLARGQAMDAQGRSREALDDYTASIAALPAIAAPMWRARISTTGIRATTTPSRTARR